MPKKGNIPWNKGLKGVQEFSAETRKRMSEAGKKKIFTKKHRKNLCGDRCHFWKGDKIKYRGVHARIRKEFGNPTKCENPSCVYPRKDKRGYLILYPKRYEWANISGKYKLSIDDWMQLCPSCHRQYDHSKIKETEYGASNL